MSVFKYLFSTSYAQKKTDWQEYKRLKKQYQSAVMSLEKDRSGLQQFFDVLDKPGMNSCFVTYIDNITYESPVVYTHKCSNFDEMGVCEKINCPYQKAHAQYVKKMHAVEKIEVAYKLFWINRFARER